MVGGPDGNPQAGAELLRGGRAAGGGAGVVAPPVNAYSNLEKLGFSEDRHHLRQRGLALSFWLAGNAVPSDSVASAFTPKSTPNAALSGQGRSEAHQTAENRLDSAARSLALRRRSALDILPGLKTGDS